MGFQRQRCQLFFGEAAVKPLGHQITIADGLCAIGHRTIACGQTRGINAPFGRCGFDQGGPASGPRLTVDGPALPDRPAAAGDHQAPFLGRIDMGDVYVFPCDFELVRQNTRDGGADVLAHLGTDDVDVDLTVGVDPVPHRRLERVAIGRDRRAIRHRRVHRRVRRLREAECNANGRHGDKEPTAGHLGLRLCACEAGNQISHCRSLP